ncbi:hypothetical protein PCYB_002990 [Plasmodium cynomolgi strain B]|uniref:Uncharacterized protein n=1 Tax=Plasmodium cynomolgi (strain B) TaxID=1120755 RepID=K6V2Q5_PLACD|nr:hypothetical protein PCYB_002990 [Plasmodium cynomolgi strain B]GAB69550.1 hypothetical protein PCYB_002990 [Plasmodium cynomolgi strain B]
MLEHEILVGSNEDGVKLNIKSIFADFASKLKGVLNGNNQVSNSRFRNKCEEYITKNGSTNKLGEYREVCVLLMEALYEIYKYKEARTEKKSDLKEWMRCKIIRTWLSYFIKIYCIPTSIAKAIYSAMQATMRWNNGGYNMCTEISNKVETNKTVSIIEEIRNLVETNLKEISTNEIGTWKSEEWCEQRKKELENAFKELTTKYPGTSTTEKKKVKKDNDFFDAVEEYADEAELKSGIVMIRDEIKKQKDAEEKAKEEAKKKATDTETVAVQAAKPAVTATPSPVDKSPAKAGKIRTEMKQSPRKCANSRETGGRTRMKRSGFRFFVIGFKGSQFWNFKVRGFQTPGFPVCRT